MQGCDSAYFLAPRGRSCDQECRKNGSVCDLQKVVYFVVNICVILWALLLNLRAKVLAAAKSVEVCKDIFKKTLGISVHKAIPFKTSTPGYGCSMEVRGTKNWVWLARREDGLPITCNVFAPVQRVCACTGESRSPVVTTKNAISVRVIGKIFSLYFTLR